MGGGKLACSFCGEPKKVAGKLIAGPGVYICSGCVAQARSQGLFEGTGDRCSFCGHAGRPTWGLGSPQDGQPKVCDACLDMSERMFAEGRAR